MKEIKKFLNNEGSEKEQENALHKIFEAKKNKDLKDNWSKKLEEKYNIKREKASLRKRKSNPFDKLFILIPIAASFLLIFTFLFSSPNLTSRSLQQLADDYIVDNYFPNVLVYRGMDSESMTRQEVVEAYNRKDFSLSIQLYQELESKQKLEKNDYFFFGLSHLYTENYRAASHQLMFYETFPDGNFKVEVSWFLALSLIKEQKFKEAKIRLKRIEQNQNYAEKVSQLIENIEHFTSK